MKLRDALPVMFLYGLAGVIWGDASGWWKFPVVTVLGIAIISALVATFLMVFFNKGSTEVDKSIGMALTLIIYFILLVPSLLTYNEIWHIIGYVGLCSGMILWIATEIWEGEKNGGKRAD